MDQFELARIHKNRCEKLKRVVNTESTDLDTRTEKHPQAYCLYVKNVF